MTTTSSVSSTSSDSNVLGTKSANYDKNMFLELLTAQLKNQTPLQPVDDQSFMNQMASYSSIEQQQSLNKNLLSLLDYQGSLARAQGLSEGTALLGKEVTYTGDDGKTARGTVASVFIDEAGAVKLKLQGGKEIDLRSVLGIEMLDANGSTTTNPGTTSSGSTSGSSGSSGSSTSSGSGSSGSSSSGSTTGNGVSQTSGTTTTSNGTSQIATENPFSIVDDVEHSIATQLADATF
jgi:flagellar basal-body rod modification protein FlgD